uniref:Uncharacterized protein n=1 Tax=Meloidogyne incognita TaxID=6306 RepID=A0A914MAP3_MELIC
MACFQRENNYPANSIISSCRNFTCTTCTPNIIIRYLSGDETLLPYNEASVK